MFMSVTIRDIAKIAGVSVTTVSHAINHTRYVNPDVVERINIIIKETGYKPTKRSSRQIYSFVLIVPQINTSFYSNLANAISRRLEEEGYRLSVYAAHNNEEIIAYLKELKNDLTIKGLFFVCPLPFKKYLEPLLRRALPMVFIGHSIDGFKENTVLFDHENGIYNAAKHLIKRGHQRIGFLLFPDSSDFNEEKLMGYKKALEAFDIPFSKELICVSSRSAKFFLDSNLKSDHPITAIICANEASTLYIYDYINREVIKCPDILSIIGAADNPWTALLQPAMTEIQQAPNEMGNTAAQLMLDRINGSDQSKIIRTPSHLCPRESIKNITRGHFGEIAKPPSTLDLTEDEIQMVRAGNYTAALSMNDLDSQYTTSYIKGMRSVFEKLNIKINTIADAHYDPAVQTEQLPGLLFNKPDIIIGQPAEEKITSVGFQKIISSSAKLIFLNNIPQGIAKDDFVTCITGNDRECGYAIGKILGDFFQGRDSVKIGLINFGVETFSPKQRDLAVEQIILEDYPNIEIVEKYNFYKRVNAYESCREMITSHPEIQGIYVSWDDPACEVLRALTDMNRTDIAVVTAEMNLEVAVSMASGGMIKGLGAQRTYEQGMAAAMAAANAILNKKVHSFIEVYPLIVTPSNLKKAWQELIKSKEPQLLIEAMRKGGIL